MWKRVKTCENQSWYLWSDLCFASTEAADDAPQFLPTQSESRGQARRGRSIEILVVYSGTSHVCFHWFPKCSDIQNIKNVAFLVELPQIGVSLMLRQIQICSFMVFYENKSCGQSRTWTVEKMKTIWNDFQPQVLNWPSRFIDRSNFQTKSVLIGTGLSTLSGTARKTWRGRTTSLTAQAGHLPTTNNTRVLPGAWDELRWTWIEHGGFNFGLP